MIKELNEGNINISKIKSNVKKLYDTYSKEFPNLKYNVFQKLETFTYYIVNIVQQSQKEELELIEEDDNFLLGIKAIFGFVLLVPCIILGFLGSVIVMVVGIKDRILDYFKDSETIKKELKQFKEKLEEQEKGFSYLIFSSFSTIMNSTTKKICMIYESGEVVNSIKKEDFEKLYNQFQTILESGNNTEDTSTKKIN